MRTLFIHAGNHKTGTTSIQRYLYQKRKVLQNLGLDVYMRGRDGYLRGETTPGNLYWWFDQKKVGQAGAFLKEGFLDDFSKYCAEGSKDVVLSSECFSWIVEPNVIESIRQRVKPYFDCVKIIFYIRRQDQHAVSHYQQASKTIVDHRFYKGTGKALPHIDKNCEWYLDYNRRIGVWGDVFGDKNITVRIFDKKVFPGGSLVQDFFDQLCITHKVDADPVVNSSIGWEKAKIRHIMWSAGINPSSNLGRHVLQFVESDGKMQPSRGEAIEFYNHFKSSNIEFNHRFSVSQAPSIFGDDFSMYPEVANDVWDEERSNKAIFCILKSVADLMNKSD